MRFAFTDDQLLFRDAVADLMARRCGPLQLRAMWDAAGAPARVERDGLWAALAEMGVLGIQVAERHGGLGLSEIDLVLLLEEAGHAGAPGPLVDTAAVGAPLLSDLGVLRGPGQLDERLDATVTGWLAAATAGSTVVTTCLDGADLVEDADRPGVTLGRAGTSIVGVDHDRLRSERQRSVDGARRLFAAEWDPADQVLLVDGEAAARLLARAADRGALATAAQLLGLGRRMLELTVDYVRERRQFGVPVGSFQAVKHHLADALLGLEFARPVVYAAAWALATGDPGAGRAVAHAKVAAGDAATFAGRQALQCHGAIGYTVDHDLHLYLKRVWALSMAWGDAVQHRRRLTEDLLGPVRT